MQLNMNQTYSEPDFDFAQISQNIRRGIYRLLGTGSARNVYDLGNGYVAKAARNIKGIGQNETEYRISLVDDSGLFAYIPTVSDGFKLLIMEKADKVHHISFIWDYFNVRNNYELFQRPEIKDISQRYGLLLNDLGRAANWGQIDKRPVIVDYGYTQTVRRKYYRRPMFRLLQ